MSFSAGDSRRGIILIGLVIVVGLLCHWRLFSLNAFFWDDTAWMYSLYSTDNLKDFLDTGFFELRRPGMGTFFYFFLMPHKLGFHPHLIWNIIQISTVLGSAIILFFLCRNLFRSEFLAFSAAAVLAVYALDATLPVNTQSVYRLGVMVGIASFFCTERALASGMRRGYFVGAVLLQIFGLLVTLESLVMLEPARMALIWYALGRRDALRPTRARLRHTVLYSAPFIAAGALESLFKMIYKPTGVYAGVYETTLANLLHMDGLIAISRYLLLGHWAGLIGYASPGTSELGAVSVLAGLFAGLLAALSCMFMVRRSSIANPPDSETNTLAAAAAFGGLLLIFPAVLHVYAGKIPSLIENSRQGAIFIFGYAVTLGTAVEGVRRLGLMKRLSEAAAIVLLCAYLVAGVFYSNTNLEAYQQAALREQRFWKAFTERFPSLPERAAFMFDTDLSEGIYERLNGFHHYQFLFPLNLLYARGANIDEFNRYAAFSFRLHVNLLMDRKFTTSDNWHSYMVNRDDITFVFWYNNTLYVNDEVLRAWPSLSALGFLDKKAPSFPDDTGQFVYRDRWP